MDVLQQAGEAVRQGDAERPQQVVPAGLHVLTGPALGVTLTAHVLVVRSHYVGDEVVVTTGCLEGEKEIQEDSDLTVSTGVAYKYNADKKAGRMLMPGVKGDKVEQGMERLGIIVINEEDQYTTEIVW